MARRRVPTPSERRVLHKGDKGNDVKAYGRALAKTLEHLHLVTINARNGVYGDGMLADTLRLQHRLHLKADGRVGPLTWTAVDPQLDAYGKALLTPKPKPPAPIGQRIAHEAQVLAMMAPVHYTQARPYARSTPTWRSRGGDCSGTSALAYMNAGAPDPNGTAYTGFGNTYSMIQRGVRVPEIATKPGDLTFYGFGGPEHMVVERGDGLVVSHGSEGGPRTLIRHYRGDYLETRRYS